MGTSNYDKMTTVQDTHHILWTGGSDSTFRVLDLALSKKKIVQPHYVMDENRKSLKKELETMQKIRELVYKLDPSAAERILDTISVSVYDIPKNERIRHSYRRLRRRMRPWLSSQHGWLSRYAYSLPSIEMEIGSDKGGTLWRFTQAYTEKVTQGDDEFYRMDKERTPEDLYQVFSHYRFPLFGLTKVDMDRLAHQRGFEQIMKHTWFCSEPTGAGKPCGICLTCRSARHAGMGKRVPTPTFWAILEKRSRAAVYGTALRIASLLRIP